MRTFGLAVGILVLTASFSFAQPVIRFNQTAHEFPAIGQEDQVEHAFEFLNAGDQELVIGKLDAS